jgi:hypothetical protein
VDSTGYVTVGSTWGGYGFTVSNNNESPSPMCSPATTVTPLCNTAGCTPGFTGEFSGTVGVCTLGTSEYQGWAEASWNVKQARGSGTTAGSWNVPASGGITITFTNPDAATVRLNLLDSTGTTQWCADLHSGVEILWSSLVTNCWVGGTPQTPLTAGQAIGQASVEVTQTSLVSSQTYDICIQNITIQ